MFFKLIIDNRTSSLCIGYFFHRTSRYILQGHWTGKLVLCDLLFCLTFITLDICLLGSNLVFFINRPEGIESLCLEMGVPHTDVRILMLAWQVNHICMVYWVDILITWYWSVFSCLQENASRKAGIFHIGKNVNPHIKFRVYS